MLHQTETAKRLSSPTLSLCAGGVIKHIAKYDFPVDYTAADDILELTTIPADSQLMGVSLAGSGLGALTADVSLMDGIFGSKDDNRDFTGDLIINDGAIVAGDVASLADCLDTGRDPEANRPVGIKISADVAAGAGTLYVVLEYMA